MADRSELNQTRREFLQAGAGGLLVSTSLTAAEYADRTPNASQKTVGAVVQTTGEISADGKQFFEEKRAIPVAGNSDVLVCGGGPAGIARLRAIIQNRLNARIPNPTPGAQMTERVTPGKGPGLNMGEVARRTMENFGRTGGAAGGGSVGNIRDKIMKTYGGM